MKKYEDETYKKEILDMIVGCECEFIDNEIRFKNGNVISIIEPKGKHIRGEVKELILEWLDDFEKANSVAVYETLKDVYSVKNVEVVKEKKACHVIGINN